MRNPVSPRHLALSVCAAATVATSLARELPAQAQSAQVLHGRVVDSASSQPIPGAVIQALGADGSVRIFDADGETPIEVDVTSGSDGVIAVCQNLIRDADIEVLVATPSALGPAVRRRLSNTTTVVPVIFTRP